jgi:hypothetical protein
MEDRYNTAYGSYRIKIATGNVSNIIWYSEWINQNYAKNIYDFGIANIPAALSGLSLGHIYIFLEGQTTHSLEHLFTDIILMPIDENTWDVQPRRTPMTSFSQSRLLVIDSAELHRPSMVSTLWTGTTDEYETPLVKLATFRNVKHNPLSLSANTDQRLWFLLFHSTVYRTDYDELLKVRLYKVGRYLGGRGDR